MKISQELLIDELMHNNQILEDFDLIYSNCPDFSEMKYGGICCYDPLMEIQEHTFYLLKPGITSMAQLVDHGNLFVGLINVSYSIISDLKIPALCLNHKGLSPEPDIIYHQLFSIIYGIFQKYNVWNEQMNLAIENEDIQELLDISFPIFNRSIYVADDHPEYLAATGPCLDYRGIGSQVPLEIFNYLKTDLENHPPTLSQKPFVYPKGILCADSLCLDLFISNDYYCRIILIDEVGNTNFSVSDEHLIQILGRSLSYLLNHSQETKIRQKRIHVAENLIELFKQLIMGQTVDENIIKSQMIRNGWHHNEHCYVGYLLLYPTAVQIKSAYYYCRYIIEHFPGIIPIEKDDHLILIIRESMYISGQQLISDFILFIRDCNFRIGLSNCCDDFKMLPHYFQQAEIALNDGLIRHNTIWCHQFCDCAFNYLLQEACHAMPAELLCAPELILLRQYDDEKKTEYYLTLKAYLNHQMNASQTAKALYIHQATMVYRLKRLEELTSIDFSDTDQMLFLHLSFKILENSERTEF